jgi:predicted dehydrogenase
MSFMKFVIIGTGNISGTYVSALRKTEGALLVGVVSRSGKLPPGCLATEGVCVAPSLDKINVPYDSVIVCTPNGLHHEGALMAAKLGKHVLVEKPLEISIPAIDKMIGACENANVKLGVSYQRRMSGDNPLIKALLASGVLGRVMSVSLEVKNFRDAEYYLSAPYRGTRSIDGGGPFIQQASHYIDLYCWFFGSPIRVDSYLQRLMHDIESEDHGIAVLQHADGMIGTITASTAIKPGFPARLELHTTKGSLIMENDLVTFWNIEGMPRPQFHHQPQQHTGAVTAAVSDTTNHEKVIGDFIDAIRENRDPLVSGAEARKTTALILEIYSSNRAAGPFRAD